MNFCYNSTIRVTTANVLNLLSAAAYLKFTEDMVPNNLYVRCQNFVETEIIINMEGILSMLQSLATSLCIDEFGSIFTTLAGHALTIQQSAGVENGAKILKLLSGLTKLRPDVVGAILREFTRNGVNFVNHVWCADTATEYLSMLDSDNSACLNARSIFSFLVESLYRCLNSNEVQVNQLHPRKLVLLLSPSGLNYPLMNIEIIKACLSAKLASLEVQDMMCLSPPIIIELFTSAVSSQRNSSLFGEDELQLADLVDHVLLCGAQRSELTVGFKESFKELAECIPLHARESHDVLYEAVASLTRSLSKEEASVFWNLIDVAKLSDMKKEIAIAHSVSYFCDFWGSLIRHLRDMNNQLKRKVAAYEGESNISTNRSYCGAQFSIFIRSIEGRTMSVVVQLDTTIRSIKELLQRTGRMQSGRSWWLIYGGKKLSDDFSVANCGLQKDCTLSIKIEAFDR